MSYISKPDPADSPLNAQSAPQSLAQQAIAAANALGQPSRTPGLEDTSLMQARKLLIAALVALKPAYERILLQLQRTEYVGPGHLDEEIDALERVAELAGDEAETLRRTS